MGRGVRWTSSTTSVGVSFRMRYQAPLRSVHFTSAFRRAHWNAAGMGGTTSRARTLIRWRPARWASIHPLDRLTLETGPSLARADPGPLAGRVQRAGVFLLQPLDQLGRRVVGGDAVVFAQPFRFPQQPAAQVRHEPQSDREVEVDVHPVRDAGGGAALFGVAQEPSAER